MNWKEVTDFVDGKRSSGRQRETFITYIGKMIQKTPMELLQMENDITFWCKLCTYQSTFTNTILNDNDD